jgi:hypothetical protein
MNPLDQALWDAAQQLWVADQVLERCRSLFMAIQKLDGEEVIGLARIGQTLTEEWSGQLDLYSQPLVSLISNGDPFPLGADLEQGGNHGQNPG